MQDAHAVGAFFGHIRANNECFKKFFSNIVWPLFKDKKVPTTKTMMQTTINYN